MKYQAVIFDLDGTLADTLEDLADSANWALRELGQPEHTVESYRLKIGSGRDKLARRSLPADREDLAGDFIRVMWDRYAEHYVDKTRLYDGVAEMLRELSMRGMRLALLSNKPQFFVDVMVDALMPRVEFEKIVGQQDGLPTKPDPAAALMIASEMGIPPGEILYVGDTDVDMQTGRSAGMRTVGVLWGFRDREELEGAGGQEIIEQPAELLTLLG